MPKKKTKKVQLNLTMDSTVKDQLIALKELAGLSSMTDVLRRSLCVYEDLWKKKNNNCTVFVRDEDTGEEREILIL